MDIDSKLLKMKEEMAANNNKELIKFTYYMDNDLDRDGNTILDKFPYKVELIPPIIDKKYDGFLDWLDDNIKEGDFTRVWVTQVYFKNEEDAVAFKLRWL